VKKYGFFIDEFCIFNSSYFQILYSAIIFRGRPEVRRNERDFFHCLSFLVNRSEMIINIIIAPMINKAEEQSELDTLIKSLPLEERVPVAALKKLLDERE
jgi:hypothetical protein